MQQSPIQVHSIRALGALSDTASIPVMLEHLRAETDKGLQMAYASALGNLGATEALDDLLSLLNETQNSGARMELALALARFVEKEHLFIRLLHQMRLDPGTTAAQALSDFKKRLRKRRRRNSPASELELAIEECVNEFARDDLVKGVKLMSQILSGLSQDSFGEYSLRIILDCSNRLAEYGPERIEYVVLALHTLNVGWKVDK